MFSEFAAGSCSSGTILGSRALRVGWLTAKNACWIAKITRITHTLRTCVAACAQKSALITINPRVVIISSLRRSIASASAPPYRPRTTRGTRPNMPVRPTYADDFVIS